MDKRKL
jgi:hypothetical protein